MQEAPNVTTKTRIEVYLSTKLYCPKTQEEQKLAKCLDCPYYKGIKPNAQDRTFVFVDCRFN